MIEVDFNQFIEAIWNEEPRREEVPFGENLKTVEYFIDGKSIGFVRILNDLIVTRKKYFLNETFLKTERKQLYDRLQSKRIRTNG